MGERAKGHSEIGTHYGADATEGFRIRKHGADGALFLDKYFLPYIYDVEGKVIGDIGTGAVPWAIVAAQNGAKFVHSLDISMGMLGQGRKALAEQPGSIRSKVGLLQGDAAALPYPDESLDLALSINVGSNLPSQRFFPHFQEMFRTLKSGSLAIVTAPTSLGVMFTTGNKSKETFHEEISGALSQIGGSHDPDSIVAHLGPLTDINGASFAVRGGELQYISDETQLIPGEQIWRKIPAGAIPNIVHTESEYEMAAIKAGFEIKEAYKDSFKSETEWAQYNETVSDPKDRLGREYIGHNRYAVYVLKKN